MDEHIGIIGGGVELEMLAQAAKGGDAGAACRLGDHHRKGEHVRYSPRKAFYWYARSALAGDATGQNQLGACYEHGVGCRPNAKQAARYYALSASQGLSTAQANLGLCYLVGRGVAQDTFEATRWLQKAADQREPVAVAKLAELRESPAHREAMHKPAPNRGGRWLESYWLKDRLEEWDCVGTDLMMSDTAEARHQQLTERYGPPTIKIVTDKARDYVTLAWSTGVGSETRLKQYGCERAHETSPA